jgi:hypothetical protein
MKYIEPKVLEKSSTCPHCGAISKQDWWHCTWNGSHYAHPSTNALRIGTCQHCNENTVWVWETLYFADNGNAPFPNQEMPENVRKLYEEAASIH